MRTFKGFGSFLDGCIEQAGPRPGPAARIVAENGGFALQEAVITTAGRWDYNRVAWSRDRRDMEHSARMRGLSLA